MFKHVVAFLFVVLVVLGTLALMGRALIADAHPRKRVHVHVPIPVCAEDAPYLRGRGDFNGTRWERYVCVHQDDV